MTLHPDPNPRQIRSQDRYSSRIRHADYRPSSATQQRTLGELVSTSFLKVLESG